MTSVATPTHTATTVRARRAFIVLAAVTSALAGWAVAAPLFGVDLTVHLGNNQPPMTIGPGPVIATALAASLAGWASLTVLERFTVRPRTIWTTTAIIVLLVSFGPLGVADASNAAKATLASLHLIVAAVLIPGLTRPSTSNPHGEHR